MLKRELDSNKIKILIPLLALLVMLLGLFVLFNHISNKRYEEEILIAESHLNTGSYGKAIEAYNKALKMRKNQLDEELTLALAEAYAGNKDYEKALEILRGYYTKSDSILIKEKIEETTCKKTDYDFQQTISRGDKYFSNEEYDKAITEYEKAKTIKSKEAISYQMIAESYVAKEDYKMAYKEIMDGLALTQQEYLNETLSQIEEELNNIQYAEYIEEALEYVYQENFPEAIRRYEEAIKLVPTKETAYIGLAETYINIGRYKSAISLIHTAMEIIENDRIDELLELAMEKDEEEEKRHNFLLDLYYAISYLEFSKVERLMGESYFKEKIAKDTPIYFNQLGESLISSGNVMIVMDEKSLYSGGIKDGMKMGMGVYFILVDNEDDSGYYYYEGEWSNDYPNGTGKTVELANLADDDEQYQEQVTSSGYYRSGLENGRFHRVFYRNKKEIYNIYYRAIDGVPVSIKVDNELDIDSKEIDQYAIGQIYKGDILTEDYYYIPKDTVWGLFSYKNHKNTKTKEN